MGELIHSIKTDRELHLFLKSELIKAQKQGKDYKTINDLLKAKLGV